MRPPRLALLALALAPFATTAEPVVVGKEEILYLDQLAEPSRWQPAEATVAQAKEQTPGKRPALHLHIPVDHHAGEAKYPIGWPRMYCPLRRPVETNWGDWDRLEFDIRATMSEGKLPTASLNFQILCPDRHQNNNRNLDEMRLGKWVTISIKTSDLKHLPELARLGFNIAESNYKDKVKLDFLIGGFRLVRSAECALDAMAITTPVIYEDAEVIKVQLTVSGPPANVSRGIPFELRQDGEVLRRETLPAQRGKRTVEMELGELRLKRGEYELIAFPGDAERMRKAAFKVIPGPWQEKAK